MVGEALSGSSFYGTPLYWWLQTPKQVCGLCNQRYRLCGYYKKPWKCFQSLPFPKLVAGLPWLSSRFANCFQWLCVPLSSSEWSMSGFRPRPGRVSSPLMPLTSKRFNHELTEMCVISVCTPTSLEIKPWDFNRMTRQRIRKAWLLPWRKPSSNCRLSDIN